MNSKLKKNLLIGAVGVAVVVAVGVAAYSAARIAKEYCEPLRINYTLQDYTLPGNTLEKLASTCERK